MLPVVRGTVLACTLIGVGAAAAWAAITSIQVTGRLTGGANAGSYVSANCTVARNGAITGSGNLYGTNPQTRANYRYPFNITSGRTARGSLTLYGKFTTGAAVSLTSAVPSGAMSFTYQLAGGRTATGTGTGTVTTR